MLKTWTMLAVQWTSRVGSGADVKRHRLGAGEQVHTMSIIAFAWKTDAVGVKRQVVR
jgi:hypothetical protein